MGCLCWRRDACWKAGACNKQTAPIASYVRAKVFKIDSGREEWFDYERIVRILRSVDYNGTVSIYYLGKDFSDCDDFEGIRLAVEHLRDVLGRVT